MQSAMRLHLRVTARYARLSHGLISHSRSFGTSPRRQDYASTLSNLRIGSKTRVIFQGFTGRQATADAQESIEWGTNIVGGVAPDREGEHLGLPMLPTVRRAVEVLKPDATAIYVPAGLAPAAIEDAIEAEVPLIVAVAEHVPLHDMLRIRQVLGTQSRSRLVGPNSPGIISAAVGERCRIGFHPLPCFSAGCVGIAARSGTLSYEAVASTTRAGLGQSLVVGVGGDVLPGTDLVEALQVLEADPATRAIALIGEIGGDSEVLAALWIRDYHARTPEAERKPIVALVAGRYSPRDLVMGHAGAFWQPGEPDAAQKIEALKAVGIPIVNHPAKIGDALKTMLQGAANRAAAQDQPSEQNEAPELVDDVGCASTDRFADAALGKDPQHQQQTRGLHSSTRGLLNQSRSTVSSSLRSSMQLQQTRSLHIDRTTCVALMREQSMGTRLQFDHHPLHYVGLSIDRATGAQCIVSGRVAVADHWRKPQDFNKILLPPGTTDLLTLTRKEQAEVVGTLFRHFRAHQPPFSCIKANFRDVLMEILLDMAKLFKTYEAAVVALHLGLSISTRTPFYVYDMHIETDDGACRPGGRLTRQHARFSKPASRRDRVATWAAAHGIVYHQLRRTDLAHDIGTVVNGAGLAMNTIDALWDLGGRAANFLDTGGKATAETVGRSFQAVLTDRRVRVVLVNIFGGLTRGDVIARGVVQAFEEQRVQVPVVVRIRGTNEAEGQAIIAGSGLPLYAFDDFDEAAKKAIELAAEAKARKEVEAEARKEAKAKAREMAREEAKARDAERAGVEGAVPAAATEVMLVEEEALEAQQAERGVEAGETTASKNDRAAEMPAQQEESTERQEDVIKTDT